MADVEQFKDDLENNPEGLVGGSRGDFMEALGEAVYARIANDQLNGVISAYLALHEVLDANWTIWTTRPTKRSTTRPTSSMRTSARSSVCSR